MRSDSYPSGLEWIAALALCTCGASCLLDDSPYPGADTITTTSAGAAGAASTGGSATGGTSPGGGGAGGTTDTSAAGPCAQCKAAGGVCNDKKTKCTITCGDQGSCATLI